ncbi:phosphatase PAP2 family protein [Flavobacterium indicum]|nr:phosphatase PAP2 family protein [Flavobacterium indicum]
MSKNSIFLLAFFMCFQLHSQILERDSIAPKNVKNKFKIAPLIIPTALISYGIIGLESHTVQDINSSTKTELKEHIDNKFTIDDFSQYSPFVSVYALNALGIQGKNSFKDRTIVLGTAYLIMGITVNAIKHTSHELRPDGSSYNSFPSGHTATAFMGAEFLYQEYKENSIWYGITGYAVATGTGFFRMYNDRHWFSDIATGAGIGILSTKIAYWLQPHIKNLLFKKESNLNGSILPYFNGKDYGFGAQITF